LDHCLADRLNLSRSRVAGLIREGRVCVNGRPVRKSYRPRRGDIIEVDLPVVEESPLPAEELPLHVVYEDDDVIVIDKPAGVVVHPAPGHRTGTLVNALLYRYPEISRVGGSTRPGIVHRLDKDTSGLMMVARQADAYRRLTDAIARRAVTRGYLAACWGALDEGDLRIDRRLGRDPRDRKRRAVVHDGNPAVTHVRVLERWRSAQLLAVRLETGRTHQIRVHLHSLGHPLVGDPLYGPCWERGFVGAGGRWAQSFVRRCGRLYLHAARLVFRHPTTEERLAFSSPLPEPLSDAAHWARETSIGANGLNQVD